MDLHDELYAPALRGGGIVDNANASLDIFTQETGLYKNIRNINVSVFKPAIGGGGILELKTTGGTVIHTWSVDAVQNMPPITFPGGYDIAPDETLQAVVSGAATTQASCSVIVTGFQTFQAAKKA